MPRDPGGPRSPASSAALIAAKATSCDGSRSRTPDFLPPAPAFSHGSVGFPSEHRHGMSGFCLPRGRICIGTTPSSHGIPIPPSGPSSVEAGQRPDDLIVRVAVEDAHPSMMPPHVRQTRPVPLGPSVCFMHSLFWTNPLAASHLPFTHAVTVGRDDHVEERMPKERC